MQGITLDFEDIDELSKLVDASGRDRELSLPAGGNVQDGEWLLITLRVGEDATCAAGRVADRGDARHVIFEQRDWEHVERFAHGDCPPSMSPCVPPSTPEFISAPAGATALLVDDDTSVLTILRAMLAGCGVDALVASSTEEALALLRQRSFNVILVEPALDGMNGLELCRRMRREPELSSLPILVLGSHTSERDIREAVCAGADDFVAKPFRALELRARVLGLMQRAQPAVIGAAPAPTK